MLRFEEELAAQRALVELLVRRRCRRRLVAEELALRLLRHRRLRKAGEDVAALTAELEAAFWL